MKVLMDDYRQDGAAIGRLLCIFRRQMRVSVVVIGGCFYKEVILIRKALAENRFNSCWEGAIVGGIARGGGTVV